MAGNTFNSTAEHPRVRAFLTGLAWLVCCAIPLSAWAGRPVRVYDVEVKGAQSPSSVQDAMRDALVRATGRRESATDPVFATLISEAQNYVKSYVPGPVSYTHLTLPTIYS